ncbi:hypothetical protein BU23DRAFT_560516 [Bimuria novae-zelandiae CBS 107.79]|uniref:BZIP domain-containing protein n=1 Tax=Bimuria novae-zelandiae CBS 107.79 TaxID=1447943 RepID=A0A6A5UQI1_9PLEO|nr:hypothetical protein BU23DRAFT_560516 [Bimuria novae-zelandiae CBS 107.79]
MGDSKKAQNLARIRDNQRRSRARRKEYLQELEAKLRECEQMGIGVSAEIQSAARRVLEENRKLRGLLYERGVTDSDIVMAMDGVNDRSYDQISAAPALNAMLERRVTCNGPTFAASPASPHSLSAIIAPHTPAIPPLASSIPRSAALSSNDSPSPHSITSSMGTPPPSFHENVPSYMPYEQSFQNSWQQQPPHLHHQQYVADPVGYYNTSSCVDAANTIRTMRTDAGPELEAELGCRVPGQHCYVANSIVFNVMDRYASPQGV